MLTAKLAKDAKVLSFLCGLRASRVKDAVSVEMIISSSKTATPDPAAQALTPADYRVTRVASTGGFARSGVDHPPTIGVDDDRVDSAIGLIREKIRQSQHRTKNAPRCSLSRWRSLSKV
ncbi:MAG: cyclic-di-AMP receptor [Anaerolineales bacterium]